MYCAVIAYLFHRFERFLNHQHTCNIHNDAKKALEASQAPFATPLAETILDGKEYRGRPCVAAMQLTEVCDPLRQMRTIHGSIVKTEAIPHEFHLYAGDHRKPCFFSHLGEPIQLTGGSSRGGEKGGWKMERETGIEPATFSLGS